MRLTPREQRQLRIAKICERHGITLEELTGRSRLKRICNVRKEVYTMLRDERVSYPVIAKMFGRDHTTVVDGVQRYRREFNGRSEEPSNGGEDEGHQQTA